MIVDQNKVVQEMHHDMLVIDFGGSVSIYTGSGPETLVLNSEIQTSVYLSSEVE